MVKRLFIRDFKNYKSPAFQNLLKTSAGMAANQRGERDIFFNALKNGIASFPGNPTKAIAKTIGILKANRKFDTSEVLSIKKGLEQSGYFVPNYIIREDSNLRSRIDIVKDERDSLRKKDSVIKSDINIAMAHRESNIRHDKPIGKSYEAKLQNIAKLPTPKTTS